MPRTLAGWSVVPALLLAGCAQDASVAYKPEPGPFRVAIADDVILPYPALDKTLNLRITFPEAPGSFPVVIFSHGGGCSRDAYEGFANHWASHGYVVIQPAHLDSSSIETAARAGGEPLMVRAARTRPLDASFIVDSFGEIESRVDGLAGRLDTERIIAAGHSMGGGTAMTLTGLVLVDRSGGEIAGADPRFDALLLITNPSNNPTMPADPWRMVGLPTFVSTGDRDYSEMAKRVKPGTGFRFPEGAIMADTPNHFLFVRNMDHYLGGLICRDDVDGEPDYDAMRIINGTSTAFLDAHFKADDGARRFLEQGDLAALTDGRGTITIR